MEDTGELCSYETTLTWEDLGVQFRLIDGVYKLNSCSVKPISLNLHRKEMSTYR